MAQQQNPKQNSGNSIPVDAETFKSLIDQQSQKLSLEIRKVALEEKKIDMDANLAEKSMELNAKLLTNQPAEHRKTTRTYAYIILGTVLLVMLFMGTCLYFGKEEFLLTVLKGLKDFGIAVLSFFIGRKTVNKKDDNKDGITDAEVID